VGLRNANGGGRNSDLLRGVELMYRYSSTFKITISLVLSVRGQLIAVDDANARSWIS